MHSFVAFFCFCILNCVARIVNHRIKTAVQINPSQCPVHTPLQSVNSAIFATILTFRPTNMITMQAHTTIIVKSVLDAWNSRLEAANKTFDSLTDEQLQLQVAPDRNRAIYLLGHLTAVHDKMLPLLNFEPMLYPQLEDVFLNKPDGAVTQIPSAKELREYWKKVNDRLAVHFNKLSPDEWFERHTSVSEADFVKEPHRNRLNVVIGRTNHLTYHNGQLALIKK